MLKINIDTNKTLTVDKKGSELIVNGNNVAYELEKIDQSSLKIFTSKKTYHVELIDRDGNELTIAVNGNSHTVSVLDHIDQILKELGMNAASSSVVKEIKAPMPGTILTLSVSEGEKVEKGSALLILEAMKMENVIKSPGEGTVKKILVSERDNVEKNELLISFE